MNHLAIVRLLSGTGFGIALAYLLSAIVAGIATEFNEAILFLVCGSILGALGGIVLLLTDRPRRKTRPQDALAVAVLFWCLTPIVTAAPFMLQGAGGGFLSAVYESASNLSTTGHSLVDPRTVPLSSGLLFWRAVLHVLGATASVSIAVTVFSALNLGGPGVHRSRFFTEPENSFFDKVPQVIRLSFVAILIASTLLGGLLLAYGVAPRDALAGAISAITTGMVDPSASHVSPAQGGVHSVLLWLGLVVGTFGLLVLENLGAQSRKKILSDPELIAWLGTIALVSLLAVFAGLPALQSLGWATSSISTSGIALSDPDQFNRLPVVLVLFPVLIGGAALSAAGGVKLARLIVLSRRVALEFVQLGYRGSVQTFSFRGRKQSERTVMGVWVYLVGYIVACTVGVLLFSMTGLAFEDAIRASVGTLSNAGHVVSGMGADMDSMAQFCAVFGMILGRLEVIALLPALNPSFWQR